ncbi:hypothetical protein BU16DRAFT_598496 [Lophium mytilinum]|uniref:Uncharacterized protein n=1 Tax=Lophium mytilinum TaxID=390894 RepID=A0A6A6QBC9_9PEZI|nr:hypothetical protein BU16DRAFT_598496 [Lophium mytilinum]
MSQIKQSLITIDQRTKETQVQPFPIAPDGTCHILPYPKNDRFVGRSDVLAQLQSFLLPPDLKGQGGTSFALYGMPGVGKTQTALQFVYSNKDKFPVIFWISASSKDKIILGYDEIARALGLNKTVTSADQEESIRLVKTWLSHTDTWWLLVFDNLDNLDDVTAFWPTSKNGAVLVTSQDPSSVHTLAKQGCRLDLFSPEEGINLITNISQATNVSISQDEAEQVARVLGYHPLAINQMATFIIKSGCSIPSFLELYAQREASNELQGIDCKCPWYKNTVAAAFDLTIERAEKLGSEASALLDVLSLFDPDKIPEQMLSKESLGAVSDVHRLVAISDLRSMTLLSDNPENNTVSVHRLVRDAALRKIKSSQVKANTAFNTAIFLLRKVFPLHGLARDHMTESWMQCEMYLSHVLALHDRYQEVQDTRFVQVSIDFVELLYSCAWYLCERGRFEISSKLICTAENTYKSLTCLETNLFWADLCTVKLFYVNETDHSSTAIELATEAHEIRETAVENGVLEEDHPNRANGLMNLGVMYTKVQPLKAIELHTSAIAIRQQSTRYRDDQVHGLALNYLNLGRSYWCAGQLDDAADSLEKCLATIKEREEACGYRFVLSGWALWALGNVQIDRGRLEEALVLHTESMDLHEKILGPLHLKTAASYHKMAWLLWKQEDDILKLALSVYDKRPEDMTAERARSKWLLSQLLKDSAPENEEWRQELDAARDLRKRIQGETQLSEDSQESYDLLVTYFYR